MGSSRGKSLPKHNKKTTQKTPTTPQTFHLFPNLKPELRVMIREHAITSTQPNIREVYPTMAPNIAFAPRIYPSKSQSCINPMENGISTEDRMLK